jgi:hypothetical protein
MIFLMATTLIAMVKNLGRYIQRGDTALTIIGGLIFIFAIWLAIEAVIRLVQYSRGKAPEISF